MKEARPPLKIAGQGGFRGGVCIRQRREQQVDGGWNSRGMQGLREA